MNPGVLIVEMAFKATGLGESSQGASADRGGRGPGTETPSIRDKKPTEEPGKEQPGRQEENPECVWWVGINSRHSVVVVRPAAVVMLV